MIPAEAVEAAAKVIAGEELFRADCDGYGWDADTDSSDHFMPGARRKALRYLEAAAPHLMADRKPKLGEGDYLPGWDDRKTLAELWQQHSPLPEGGLREGTYDALIAVATWGYQQRKDEEL